ncbi:MAG: hypothetical protein AAF702_31295 [Chloroflexota bacterium]
MKKLSDGIHFLAAHGLNLFAVFDCHSLPRALQQVLLDAKLSIDDYPRLILLGHGGRQLWRSLKQDDTASKDPVDDFSQRFACQFIQDYLDDAQTHFLYPGSIPLSLIRLGELAGWSYPSPLGLGINPIYGLWFAYRAAFLTAADVSPTVPLAEPHNAQHPCESCQDKPCITTCPVRAVQWNQPFNIESCYNHRRADASPCVDRCLSRLACPVGKDHQYTVAQIQHHYDLSRSIFTARKR